jgi:putative CocE/NonD family hydrolase
MRDGVLLRADVYRPASGGPAPVLLQRTPYGKNYAQTSFALLAAERGYAVVIQDTRGRWSSEGKNYPFLFEREDGYDTVEWVGSQPWSNGKVGMFGGSYGLHATGCGRREAAFPQPSSPPLPSATHIA